MKLFKLLLLILVSIALEQLMPSNGYDLAIVPALIGAIGAIGGAALGAASNNKNISQNQMNNEFNAREAQKARDFQLEMWNRQNEYNSPANQRGLRAEAATCIFFPPAKSAPDKCADSCPRQSAEWTTEFAEPTKGSNKPSFPGLS